MNFLEKKQIEKPLRLWQYNSTEKWDIILKMESRKLTINSFTDWKSTDNSILIKLYKNKFTSDND